MESINAFQSESRHKIRRRVSGKHQYVGAWMVQPDFRNDRQDPGGRNAGVRCNHKVDLNARFAFTTPGQYVAGVRRSCPVPLSPQYPLKTLSRALTLASLSRLNTPPALDCRRFVGPYKGTNR